MGFIGKLLHSAGIDLTASIGNVLDDLITTEEELQLSKTQQDKIKSAYRVRMQELMNQLDTQYREHDLGMAKEATERLRAEMNSDSWLAKNVRPLTMLIITGVVCGLAALTIWQGPGDQQALDKWIGLFETVMMVVYGFYFGSRAIEKTGRIWATGRVEVAAQRNANRDEDQEPRG